jgi:predicted phosphodiesterase
MKVAVCSDLHLEFGDLNITNDENIDVLILSGDICVAKDIDRPEKGSRVVDFFKRCSFQFPNVVYVMGNHEHYHGDFATSPVIIQKMIAENHLNNVHFLDKESVVINDVLFVGGTLWTDMNKEDPLTLYQITRRMNDFQIVSNSDRKVSYKIMVAVLDESGNAKIGADGKPVYQAEFHERNAAFTPEDAVVDHKAMLKFLTETLTDVAPWQSVVVVGHHAPSKSSTHPRYKNETLMNGAYSSELSEFILDHPEIKLWTHGHTHEDFDYMIGSTRVVCNPRGYINYEARADNFKLKVVEV